MAVGRARRRLAAPPAAVVAAVTTVLLWGSAFAGIRVADRQLGAGPLALGRLLVGSLTLAILVLVQRRRRPGTGRRFSRTDLAAVALCGLLWFGAYNVVLNAGERRVDAGTAAMLVNVGPILIALLAGVVLREGFPRRLAQGLAVAFCGALIIGVATRSRGATAGIGAVECLLAALCYAGGVVAQKPALGRHAALDVTCLACVVGTVACLPFAPRLIHALGHVGSGTIAWMVYLGIGPTAIAFTTWAYALSRTTAGRMGALTYLVPPLAVAFGWIALGEVPPVGALLGGLLCLTGVALTRRRQPLGTPSTRVPRKP